MNEEFVNLLETAQHALKTHATTPINNAYEAAIHGLTMPDGARRSGQVLFFSGAAYMLTLLKLAANAHLDEQHLMQLLYAELETVLPTAPPPKRRRN